MYYSNDPVPGAYSGDGKAIFRLALWTSFLTLITLGIYRFWAKTRIRKYIWSSTSFRGDTFEYTGTGLEKFLGFLVAIVILAVYLAIIQMVLFYFGFAVFSEAETVEGAIAQMVSIYLTIFAVVPLWFFAMYRARRYKMARSRWRGIRLGMEKGAWGYSLRAIGYWILTIGSIGLLLPLQTFRLEKYMTDRSWYGNARFVQGGKWTALYGSMKHIFIGVAILIAGGVMLAAESAILGVILTIVGYIWVIIGGVYYNVRSFAYMAEHKVLDETVQFTANPRTGEIIKLAVLGAFGVSVLAGVFFGIAGSVAMTSFEMDPDTFEPIISPVSVVVSAIAYVGAILMAGALSLAMITQPIIRHYVETLTIRNPEDLDRIRQRAYDDGADAEGFADALDVGGAI